MYTLKNNQRITLKIGNDHISHEKYIGNEGETIDPRKEQKNNFDSLSCFASEPSYAYTASVQQGNKSCMSFVYMSVHHTFSPLGSHAEVACIEVHGVGGKGKNRIQRNIMHRSNSTTLCALPSMHFFHALSCCKTIDIQILDVCRQGEIIMVSDQKLSLAQCGYLLFVQGIWVLFSNFH